MLQLDRRFLSPYEHLQSYDNNPQLYNDFCKFRQTSLSLLRYFPILKRLLSSLYEFLVGIREFCIEGGLY